MDNKYEITIDEKRYLEDVETLVLELSKTQAMLLLHDLSRLHQLLDNEVMERRDVMGCNDVGDEVSMDRLSDLIKLLKRAVQPV